VFCYDAVLLLPEACSRLNSRSSLLICGVKCFFGSVQQYYLKVVVVKGTLELAHISQLGTEYTSTLGCREFQIIGSAFLIIRRFDFLNDYSNPWIEL